eukprot:g1335.t1
MESTKTVLLGEWEDWGDWKSKSYDKSKGYDYDKSYGYRDWSNASRSRSAPRGGLARQKENAQRSASQGTEHSRSGKAGGGDREVETREEEGLEARRAPKKARIEEAKPEAKSKKKASGADLFKEAVLEHNLTDGHHDDRADRDPWIGGPDRRASDGPAPEVSDKPLEGRNTDPERPFDMRFNDAPRAEDVRPLSVLREAFQKARQRWTQKRDWSYVGEMLRSIRQDLTIQMVKDAFVVEVHEYWAQVALEFGDFKQFDQAAVQLEAYYADPALESGAAKLKETPSRDPTFTDHVLPVHLVLLCTNQEVLAWRLLYLTVEGEGLATLEFLQRHQRHLKEGAVVKFAWRLRRAMSQRCYPQAVKLLAPMVSTETDLPVLPESLRAELLRRARLLQLMTVCKALSREKALTRKRLESLGLQSEDGTKSLPIIFRKEDQELVDPQATHDEAKKELEPAEVRDTTMPGSTWNVRTVAVKGTIAAWAGPQETLRDHMQSQTLWGSDANWGWLGFLAPTSSEDATRISQRFNCSPSILVSVCGTTLTSSPVLYRDPTELLRLLSSCDCCHDGQQKESPVSHQPSCAGQVRIRRRLGRQHEDHLNGFMRAVPGTPRENGPFKAERRPRMVD